MNVTDLHTVYFVGIGGIGMSALARYFNFMGKRVYGYDRTPTALTAELQAEGIEIHFDDSVALIPESLKQAHATEHALVIYTPAIPESHSELQFFRTNKFKLLKRAQALGLIIKDRKGVAISGTHGKTSTTTCTAHLLKQSNIGCSAFLGGISKNYNTNFLFSASSPFVVVEADEFDRSFHQLFPEVTVITAMDPDHLDIYGTEAEFHRSFYQFIGQIKTGGSLISKLGLPLEPVKEVLQNRAIEHYTYSQQDTSSDFYALNIRRNDGAYLFDIQTPMGLITDVSFKLPGLVNIENAVAATAAALCSGVELADIKRGLQTFAGVQRRLEYQINTDKVVYINDYAHHPEELRAAISSIKHLYPERKISGVFQPHLYSRTKDFAAEFAKSLSLLDECILLDIYPARELPIPGVTSEIVFKNISSPEKTLCTKQELLSVLENRSFEVLLTMGAGDIDNFVEPIKTMLNNKNSG